MNPEKGAPPPYGMNMPQQHQPPFNPNPPSTHVVHVNPAVFGPHSCTTVCPSCNSQVTTRITEEITTKTHIIVLLLCLIMGPCSLFVYCCDSCKAVEHYCPNCGAYLGRFDR